MMSVKKKFTTWGKPGPWSITTYAGQELAGWKFWIVRLIINAGSFSFLPWTWMWASRFYLDPILLGPWLLSGWVHQLPRSSPHSTPVAPWLWLPTDNFYQVTYRTLKLSGLEITLGISSPPSSLATHAEGHTHTTHTRTHHTHTHDEQHQHTLSVLELEPDR